MLLFLHDFRRLIEAGTATVENQSHKTAADQKGKEDAETHHQPAPRRHDHVASRFPPVMADPYRSGQNREKNEYGQCGFHLITAGSAWIATQSLCLLPVTASKPPGVKSRQCRCPLLALSGRAKPP